MKKVLLAHTHSGAPGGAPCALSEASRCAVALLVRQRLDPAGWGAAALPGGAWQARLWAAGGLTPKLLGRRRESVLGPFAKTATRKVRGNKEALGKQWAKSTHAWMEGRSDARSAAAAAPCAGGRGHRDGAPLGRPPVRERSARRRRSARARRRGFARANPRRVRTPKRRARRGRRPCGASWANRAKRGLRVAIIWAWEAFGLPAGGARRAGAPGGPPPLFVEDRGFAGVDKWIRILVWDKRAWGRWRRATPPQFPLWDSYPLQQIVP